MKIRFVFAIAFSLALATAAYAQDGNSAPPPSQDNGGGNGQRGGRGGYGGGMGAGRGMMGTVTEVAPDHYVVKNEAGESYTVHFSANTRIFKQAAGQRGGGQGQGGQGQGGGMGRGGNPPQQIKATDIKVGDVIMAMGEVDATAKSVGAMIIAQVDPERVRQMQEMAANYGKTWLSGKVTAVDGVKVLLMGNVDNMAHSFVADENTTFRKRRDPITLADIQVGDTLRAEGALKDGVFTATTVDVTPQGGMPNVPRNAPAPQ
jgi:hypothetical protein